jgi:acyl-CoA synthetase (NDP forming)
VDARSSAIEEVVAGRAAGSIVPEPEAQRITALLGVGTPEMVVVADPGAASRIAVAGARVVVKAVGPAHKAALGGVRIVANTPGAIAGAATEVAAVPGATGVLIAEWIDHDPEAELIAGVRWSEAFGPIVSIGPGGASVERRPAPAIIAAPLADRTRRIVDANPATRGVRGIPELVEALLELGHTAMPGRLTEFEINPLVMTGAGPIALDALGVVGIGDAPAHRIGAPADAIAAQLRPGSIAIVGVSDGPNPGRQILRNVIAAGFSPSGITVIKPGADTIEGCRCVESIAALDGTVDLLVVAIAGASVPDLMTEVVERSAARSVVLIPGGLGERPGTEERARRIVGEIERARRSGRPTPAVTGPNSMGILSVPGRFDATFIPRDRMTSAPRRRAGVAVVAQSGAFILSRLDRLPWLQPDYVVSVGNQIDLTIGGYLEHFADDPEIHTVACYVEGFVPGDGDRILRAARRLTDRGGMVLWHRAGRTTAGAGAARSHTAAIATDDAVAASLARDVGIVESSSLQDWEDLLRLAVAFGDRPIAGRRIGVVSNAGFECVSAADSLGTLEAPPFSPATGARLDAALARHGLAALVSVRNPLDLTPSASADAYGDCVAALLDEPGLTAAVVGCVPFTPALDLGPDGLPDRLAALAGHPTPWVLVIDAGRAHDPIAEQFEGAGVPVVRTMDRAVRLLGRYVESRVAHPSP